MRRFKVTIYDQHDPSAHETHVIVADHREQAIEWANEKTAAEDWVTAGEIDVVDLGEATAED